MNFDVRNAHLNDLQTLIEFNENLALETEGKILNRDILSNGVKLLLSDTSKGFYLLAEQKGKIAGQLMITYETSDWRNGIFWWIQSVYVHKDYRQQGVFSTLYKYVEQLAKSSGGCCGIRLYVETQNHIAQQVYYKLGMLKTDYLLLEKDFRNEQS